MTYKQINYMYIQKESVRCILIKIKYFSNFKGFHNEIGFGSIELNSILLNKDKFLISILFSVFISSIILGIFNLFQ